MKSVRVPIPDRASIKKTLLIVVGIILAVTFTYLVRQIWLPIALAFLLAMVLDPVVDRMELRGWSRVRASAFIFGSFIVIVGGLAVLAYPFVIGQIGTLQDGFGKYFPDPSHAGLIKSFRNMGLSPSLANACVSTVESARAELQHSSSSLTNVGMAAASNAIWIVIIPIVAFYALRDFHIILAKGLLLIPAKSRDMVQVAVTEITAVFGKFLRGLAIVAVLNGVATAILLSALRVPGALILGVAAGLLYSVPYIGALITIVLTAGVAFVGGGPHLALLAVALSFVLHQIVFDQIVSPRILGGQVGLHPILSIIALLCGNLLLGIIGMILAVPVAACIQIAVLAVVPKLSKRVEISGVGSASGDTVSSLEAETKATERKTDAAQETRLAVISAVDAIEQEIEAESKEGPVKS
jgi:predicted PurR-regulated permease PerM